MNFLLLENFNRAGAYHFASDDFVWAVPWVFVKLFEWLSPSFFLTVRDETSQDGSPTWTSLIILPLTLKSPANL